MPPSADGANADQGTRKRPTARQWPFRSPLTTFR